MRHYKRSIALTSLYTLVSSSEHQRSTGELVPWQVTKFSTFSPSGRPGSDTNAHIWANITNPSSFPAGPGASFEASEANCTLEWSWQNEEPYGRVFECITAEEIQSASSSSKWTIEASKASGNRTPPTENVDVKFTLTSNLTVDSNEFYKVLVGTQHFEVGENMKGQCGGSGVCSWYLDDERTPVLIQPTIVACEGTC